MSYDVYNLFIAESMKEVERITSELTIFDEDIKKLRYLSEAKISEFPFLHDVHFFEEAPEGLNLTSKNLEAISTAPVGEFDKNSKKAINKILQMPKQVKRVSGHLFYRPDYKNWHLFYSDIRDRKMNDNHWKYGPHIHYVSHLWPNLDCKTTWKSFCKTGKKEINGKHIKYRS
jgi:hypothetical protein